MAFFSYVSVNQRNRATSVNVIGFGGALVQGAVQLQANTALVIAGN